MSFLSIVANRRPQNLRCRNIWHVPLPHRRYTVPTRKVHCWVHCTVALFLAAFSLSADITPAQLEFFESKIRPVLAQECYECHSSRGKSKGGLLLDHRDGLLEGGDTGPALVPGKADESLIIEALKHEFDLEMPKAGVKLDPPIIADFERWINMGAPDPRDQPPTDEELEADTNWSAIFETRKNWWSFQPIKKPEIPDGTATRKIDRFIQAKLVEKNLHPSPPAEPRTLARRLHYALTGLPASPEALDKFEKQAEQDRETAIDQLIDSLLANPHFGERWARHWMDWIRYAESHGSEGDPKIDNAHLYRDYLIRALNADIGYDQLLREHVAGDLLPDPRINQAEGINESVLGAIHWRMVFHGFAPTDALDEKVRFTDDQINTFTKAFQGLTVSCARCHDHKFDAISQADYYALFGIFGSTRPGRKLVELPNELEKNKAKLANLKPKIRQAIANEWLGQLDQVKQKLLAEKPSDEARSPDSIFHPFHLLQKDPKLTAETALERVRQHWANVSPPEPDGLHFDLTRAKDARAWFKYGNGVSEKPVNSGDFLIAPRGDQAIEQILPSGMYSGLLSTKHAGRLTSPDFKLDGKKTLLLLVNGDGKALNRYVVQNYPRSGTVFKIDRLSAPSKKNKDGNTRPEWRWKNYKLDYWSGDEIHIELATARDTALLVDNTERSWFGIRQAMLVDSESPMPRLPRQEYLGAILESSDQPAPNSAESLADFYISAIRKSIDAWRKNVANDPQALLLDYLTANQLLPNDLKSLPETAQLISEYRKLESEINAPTRVPGLDEWVAADQPLFERGNHKKPLEPVSRRFIDAVDNTPYQTNQSGRLQLAEDLLREDNPFTKRVIVNRIWTHLFGSGIVGSVDNFGRLGEKPSHPELLDYLAVRFESVHQWSIKSLVKEIVSSATWQQSSEASPGATSTDPDNRLLSHFPVRRLEAEAIRDKVLAVAGRLDRSLYGPATDGSSTRRSVYVQVIRNRLDPFLGVFDAPIPFSTTGKRPETNVPAQSLTMLNDSRIIGYARDFARRFTGNETDRIEEMWNAALGRHPTDQEIAASRTFLGHLRNEGEALNREIEKLRKEIDTLSSANQAITGPARQKLKAELKIDVPLNLRDLGAVAHWDFQSGSIDLISGLEGRMVGNARIEDDTLVLDGQSCFLSDPLPVDFREKTLEVVVSLDHFRQKGGGALTIQTLDGSVFDSIVFAERKSGEWLAGSDHHNRTIDFKGEVEKEADLQPVHLAIAYDSDGTIRGYRNGVTYGSPYIKGSLVEYKKKAAQVALGLRHGTRIASGRCLTGRIHEARIYNTALDGETIAGLATGKRIISKKQVLDSLTDTQRKTYQENVNTIATLHDQLAELEKSGSKMTEDTIWQNYAHSLFNLKEFIYLY